MSVIILAIESSCDDTSAAVIRDGVCLSNVVSSQEVHRMYGGVVPELASREHQKNMVPVVEMALEQAGITRDKITAIGYTRGPGLLGSLLVGASFAKGLSMGWKVPLIEVHHMQAHILAHFIRSETSDVPPPSFPFLCLTVSGGHTQLVRVDDPLSMYILGETRDDAAGEAFDKIAKIMGLPYPGGPELDRLAREGNPKRFSLPVSEMPGYDFSFSGLKTAFLYLLRKEVKGHPDFVEENKHDLAASAQAAILQALMRVLRKAVQETGIRDVALAGGVSANSGLRQNLRNEAERSGWNIFIPPFEYTTDNAAMIGIAAYYRFLNGAYDNTYRAPSARLPFPMGRANGKL
ncbi:MAG: tRNA (adenosine(37)-N6)-threonylcarbamoyltransferase complex transferase subunit TsaD [Leptolyngbya sp. SIO3F4]|nr:tRNA (adenosine(37)-N6)-threonylcarbamoyltransferase complex transferase subunit TsaD [Leptolyngbya sp. SIO3F4]